MALTRALAIQIAFAAASIGMANDAPVQASAPAAVYQRQRYAPSAWRATDPYGGGYRPYGVSLRYGYRAGFGRPLVIAGDWYERPYPYHLDYYRYRWGGLLGPTEEPLAVPPVISDSDELPPSP